MAPGHRGRRSATWSGLALSVRCLFRRAGRNRAGDIYHPNTGHKPSAAGQVEEPTAPASGRARRCGQVVDSGFVDDSDRWSALRNTGAMTEVRDDAAWQV